MTGQHASDCAVHNEPAYPAGPCDCHLSIESRLDQMIKHAYQGSTEAADEIRQELIERYKAMQPVKIELCQDFWEWLPKAYGDVGDERVFTKYNMEVAFAAGAKAEAKRMWVGLTDEEVMNCYMFWVVDLQDIIGFYKGVETKLKEKNT